METTGEGLVGTDKCILICYKRGVQRRKDKIRDWVIEQRACECLEQKMRNCRSERRIWRAPSRSLLWISGILTSTRQPAEWT